MDTFESRLADRIASLITADVSGRTLAERSGLKSPAHVTDTIRGLRRPDAIDVRLSTLRKIAAGGRVSLAWLVAGEGSKGAMRHDELPGWAAAAEQAIRERKAYPFIVRAVGATPASVVPPTVTPDFVADVCLLWLRYAPLEERIRAEQESRAEERGEVGPSSDSPSSGKVPRKP